MSYPKLDAIRSLWEDLATDLTLRYFEEITVCELEQLTRVMLDAEVEETAHVCKLIREQVPDQALADKCVNGVLESVSKRPSPDTATAAHFIGGEQGMRIGAIAAETMIFEANRFSELSLKTRAPWLFDAEDDD